MKKLLIGIAAIPAFALAGSAVIDMDNQSPATPDR
jgi:hypothetical protein